MKPKSTHASRRSALKELMNRAINQDRDWQVSEVCKYHNKALVKFDGVEVEAAIGTAVSCTHELLAYDLCREGWSSGVVDQLRRFLSYAYLNARAGQAMGCIKADTAEWVADHAGVALVNTHWTCWLLAITHDWAKARWLASYLLQFYDAGGLRNPEVDDRPYYQVFRLLLEAIRDEHWPITFTDELGVYQDLLIRRTDVTAASAALGRVMDVRMARYNGYPDVDAGKRISSSQENVIGCLQHTALPADIWVIQALTRRFDGVEMSLEGEHPWLQAIFMKPPPAGPLEAWSDDLTEHIIRVGNERFATGWLDV